MVSREAAQAGAARRPDASGGTTVVMRSSASGRTAVAMLVLIGMGLGCVAIPEVPTTGQHRGDAVTTIVLRVEGMT